ncbi:MAG: peptidoglycan D,D-transpeptidase FtsI family protein [Planktomarina sp.]
MIRKPLRPLAGIFAARAKGEDPDKIERMNLRERRLYAEDRAVRRTKNRLLLLSGIFVMSFATIGTRMVGLAVSEAEEPRSSTIGTSIMANRSDILDRNGRVLATNMETYSLYAHPYQVVDPAHAATQLARIFPDMDPVDLAARLGGDGKFMWLQKSISPEERQAVHDIGDPGLLFGPREMRLYPNGKLASHILGGASFGKEGTYSAEVVGVAGVEKAFDSFLRDPANGGLPLQLSLDLTVQAAIEKVLYGGMRLMNAKAASATLMDVRTGEIIAMVSLPDFDPNKRPRPLIEGDRSDDPLFNRSVQGLYEFGSTFKLFTIAQAMNLGLVDADTMVATKGPITIGGHKIEDFSDYGPRLSVEKVLVKSSNIGTIRIADMIGTQRQKAFLDQLGLLHPTEVELIEGPTGRPQFPKTWRDINRATISYGHGLSTSQVHLAAAYSAMVNGGTLVQPTIVRRNGPIDPGVQVISPDVSRAVVQMLRNVVTEGTASYGVVPGFAVGGKTGTAEKLNPKTGKYFDDKVLATFASVFPTDDPKYTLIVTLDEPEDRAGAKPRRTAGATAVPVAAEIIRRIAPLLNVPPVIEHTPQEDIDLAQR